MEINKANESVTEVAQDSQQRQPWIEPSVIQLDVRETAINPGRGLDYGLYYQNGPPFVDCTRS